MLGKIVLEEAYERPGMQEKSKHEASLYIAPWDRDRYMRQIDDTHDERLRLSNEHGIGYTVVSLTVPGIQGITNKAEAEKTATETNNWVAEQIKDHRDRLGAFACLSMHNPIQAGQELRRCIQELGFHGALLCDFQHAQRRDISLLRPTAVRRVLEGPYGTRCPALHSPRRARRRHL